MSYKAHMNGGGESYSGVIPAKQLNKSGRPPAEVVEGRELTKENMDQQNLCRTQSRESGPSALTVCGKRQEETRSHGSPHYYTM